VSLLSRKQPADDVRGLRGHAISAARQAVPAAKSVSSTAAQQAVPLARSAGTSVKQGADGAIAWATPYADAARSWAAPRLEQSAAAISDSIAPMISDALITVAHKIDASQPKPRRFSKSSLFAGSMLLIAAGTATAFTLLHRHERDGGYTAATPAAYGEEPGRASDRINDSYAETDPGMPPADADGHPPTA
jgi:hypothetical protein